MHNNRFTLVLIVALMATSIASLFVGVLDISLLTVLTNIQELEILLISRLPRLMAILMAGMGLAVAGLIMQNLCMNKFVSPSTAATIQSSQLGLLCALLFLPTSTLMERAFFAFGAAMLGTWIFVSFIQRVQMKDIILVPLVGIMFGNIISGVTNFIAFKYDMTQALASFTVGHFSTVIRGHYEIVYIVFPILLTACFFARHFNIVGMGKNFASNLGINYQFFLFLGLTLAAMLTASVVTVVGTISYVGLIVPNLVTIYKGDNLRNTILDTALCGALFVLVCDILGRIIIFPYELPIELIIGCVGSVTFIGLIFYRLSGKQGKKAKLNELKSMFSQSPCGASARCGCLEENNSNVESHAQSPKPLAPKTLTSKNLTPRRLSDLA